MNLTNIELINFRNYKKCSIKLGKKTNIFIGSNGQGKTNILESIYILALTKSHRFGEQSSLIRKDMTSCKIKGTLKKNRIISDLEIDISKQDKKVMINKTEIRKIADYISTLNVIMFTPDDLEIIKGSPQGRRNLLNVEISQINKDYIKYLNEYNKLLKTRNEYLKSMLVNNLLDNRYFDIITDKLIERAIKIYKIRKEFIDNINMNIGNIYKNITSTDGLYIKYDSLFENEGINEENYVDFMKSKFKNNIKREMMQGTTLYGPHRDDFSFYINEDNVKIFSSQGIQRMAVISLKLSEIIIFKEKTGFSPILLLDDVFSEIDNKRKNKLIKYIDQDVQTIITTTDIKNLNKKLLENSKIFEVFSGNIREKVGEKNDR